jgi:hypothetical protein
MAAIFQRALLSCWLPFLLEERHLLRFLLEGLVVLVNFLLALEQIEESVCASNEVGMVGVDVSVLDLDQVHDHLSGGSEALVEDALHDIADLVLQLLIPVQLRQVYLVHDVSQLLIHLMSAVQRGIQQSRYLLSHQDFEGNLGDEETGTESLGILDGCLDVLVGEMLERVDAVDGFDEDLMEDEVDPGPSQALDGALLDELALDHVAVGVSELVDQIQDQWSLVLLVTQLTHVESRQLYLLLAEQLIDLLAQVGDALQDMSAEDLVHRSAQVAHSQLIRMS